MKIIFKMQVVMRPLFLLFFVLSASFLVLAETTRFSTSPMISPPESEAAPPSPIQDNSFLVEEAYNQEDGVIQHISFVQPTSTGDLVYTQTDEWPLRSLKHQLSLTVGLNHSAAYAHSGPGWGDTAINYRYQLLGNGETKVAIAPRFSLLLPTGDSSLGRGYGSWGMQVNVPVSIQHTQHLVTHWNAGVTLIPSAQNAFGQHATAVNPNLGQSTVWLAKPRFNVLCEVVWSSNAYVTGPQGVARTQSVYVSPGVRWAYNFKNGLQIVPGVGIPFGFLSVQDQKVVIFYL